MENTKLPQACIISKVKPVRYASIIVFILSGFMKPSTCHRFIIQSNINPNEKHIKEYLTTEIFLYFLPITPEMVPTSPQENICQGVQGPCPKNMLEVNAAVLPTRNPAKGPNIYPEIDTMKVVG